MSAAAHHETFSSRVREHGSSDRQFGTVMGLFFAALGLWPLRHGGNVRLWAVALAAAILALAWFKPSLLHQANRVWTALGMLIGRVTVPLVTGILFFLVFTPAGLLMRLAGKDPLRLRTQASLPSYWIGRDPESVDPKNMVNQF